MSRVAHAGAAVLAVVCVALASPARAQDIGAPPLSAAELADMRGGFMLPSGVEAQFGAVARTFSEGVLVLETHFSWTETGVQREQVLTGPQLVSTNALANGFEIQDANGATVFAHQIDDAGVRNVLLNQADGRDIRIDTELTVTLPNFAATQQGMTEALLALHLFDDMQAAP